MKPRHNGYIERTNAEFNPRVTARQTEFLRVFSQNYCRECKSHPTTTQLGDIMGIDHRTAHAHMAALIDLGMVDVVAHTSPRRFKLTELGAKALGVEA